VPTRLFDKSSPYRIVPVDQEADLSFVDIRENHLRDSHGDRTLSEVLEKKRELCPLVPPAKEPIPLQS